MSVLLMFAFSIALGLTLFSAYVLFARVKPTLINFILTGIAFAGTGVIGYLTTTQ